MFEIPHQIQTSFSPVSSINSSQTDIALPVKTCKRNFVTFFVYFGNSSFDYLWNFFVTANREAILVVTLRVWRRSLGGTGSDWGNSTGYIHWYTHTHTLDSTLEWAPNLGSPVNTISYHSNLFPPKVTFWTLLSFEELQIEPEETHLL